ncbi:hypothetical protein [Novosphingobium colocasiae]|uniref:hypothetical protein n=1 Tax=Novosphingobium colocasiae TaxID=1256513 RepID=UPI0035AF251B
MIEGTHAGSARASANFDTPDRTRRADPRRRMSDQIAYALLVYTALQIFATVSALQGSDFALLPYLALVALVLAIIPACRLFEQRWGEMSDAEATAPATMRRFRRDRTALWALALGLPFLLTGLFKGAALLLA